MKKLHVWIISDEHYDHINMWIDQVRYDEKLCNHVKKHLLIEQILVESFTEVMDNTIQPDLILMDMSTVISKHGYARLQSGDFPNLVRFARKHTSSILVLMSYVNSWAKEIHEELKEELKDEVVVEFCENGDKSIAEYLSEKVFEYYPMESTKK